MGCYFYKVVWIKEGESTGNDITNWVVMSAKRGLATKQSSCEFQIKNSDREDIIADVIKIKNNDIIKIYADTSPITEASSQLLMTAIVEQFGGKVGEKGRQLKIKCADKSSIILNQVYPGKHNDVTVPNIIKAIIQWISREDNVGANDPITTTNVATTRSDSSAFPAINFYANYKPAYELISELSTYEYTNSAAEISGTMIDPLSYIFWVDEDNDLHWIYPTSGSPDYTIAEGDGTRIYSIDFKKTTFEIVNMIIFRAGEDKNGNGITWYSYDTKTEEKKINVKVHSWKDISYVVKMGEEDSGDDPLVGVNSDLDGAVAIGDTTISLTDASSFPSSGTIQIGSGENISDSIELVDYSGKSSNDLTGCTRGIDNSSARAWEDAVYVLDVTKYAALSNGAFRTLCKSKGEARCKAIFDKNSGLRWKGKIELAGTKYKAGELMNFTSKSLGIVGKELRIVNVTHNLTTKGWFTTLDLEEDQKPRVKST